MPTDPMLLELAAFDLATEASSSMEEARAALRIEMVRYAVALGALSIAQANDRLRGAGVTIGRVSSCPE